MLELKLSVRYDQARKTTKNRIISGQFVTVLNRHINLNKTSDHD